MGWLDRLKSKPKSYDRPTLPTVKGHPDLLMTPPALPKMGTKSSEEFASDLSAYIASMRSFFAHNAAIRRKEALAIGIEEYRWVMSAPDVPCSVALKNDGKIFRYDASPPEGHPQEGKCDADWCRCFPKAIVKGFS